MQMNRELAIQVVGGLLKGGVTPFILDEIKKDIANEILQTQTDESAKREELYMFCKSIDLLEQKLQDYVNKHSEGELTND